MIIASKNEHYEICDYLLSHKVDLNFASNDKLTPLYHVCKYGNSDLASKFIKHGADVNAEGCLNVALEFYHHDIATLLLDNNCDPNKVRYNFI